MGVGGWRKKSKTYVGGDTSAAGISGVVDKLRRWRRRFGVAFGDSGDFGVFGVVGSVGPTCKQYD